MRFCNLFDTYVILIIYIYIEIFVYISIYAYKFLKAGKENVFKAMIICRVIVMLFQATSDWAGAGRRLRGPPKGSYIQASLSVFRISNYMILIMIMIMIICINK